MKIITFYFGLLIIILCLVTKISYAEKNKIIGKINGKKITLQQYKEWLYNNANLSSYIENYITSYLFDKRAKEMGIRISIDEYKKALNLKKYPKMEYIKDPFLIKANKMLRKELWSDLRASKIICKQKRDVQIDNILYNKYGYRGKKYILQCVPIEFEKGFNMTNTNSIVFKNKLKKIYKQLQQALEFYKQGKNFQFLRKRYAKMVYFVNFLKEDSVNKWILNWVGTDFGDKLFKLKKGDIKILQSKKGVYLIKIKDIIKITDLEQKRNELEKRLCPLLAPTYEILDLGLRLERAENVFYFPPPLER